MIEAKEIAIRYDIFKGRQAKNPYILDVYQNTYSVFKNYAISIYSRLTRDKSYILTIVVETKKIAIKSIWIKTKKTP